MLTVASQKDEQEECGRVVEGEDQVLDVVPEAPRQFEKNPEQKYRHEYKRSGAAIIPGVRS